MAANRNPFEDLPNLKDDKNPFADIPENKNLGPGGKLKRAAGILGEDILKAPGALGDLLVRGINAAPSEVPGAALQFSQQLATGNPRFSQNIASGTGKVGQAIANIPSDMERFIKHLGLQDENKAIANNPWPRAGNPLGSFAPQGQPQAGDVLSQELPMLATLRRPISAGANIVGKTAKAGINQITGTKKYAALKEKLGVGKKQEELGIAEKQLEEARSSHEKALTEHEKTIAPYEAAEKHFEAKEPARESALEAHETAKNLSKEAKNIAISDVGVASPHTMQHQITEHNKNIKDINQNIDALSHQMENIPPAPKIAPSDISHIENAHQARAETNNARQNLRTAQETHENAEKSVKNTEQKIDSLLEREKPHAVENAVRLQKAVEGIETGAASRYKKLVEEVKGNSVSIGSYTNAKLRKNASPELQSVLDHIPEKGTHKIEDVLTNYQDLRKARHELMTGLKEDPSAASRRARIKAYNESSAAEAKLRNALNRGLGSKSGEFKAINKVYREQVFPLRSNEHVRQAEKGALPENMMKAFSKRGTKRIGIGQQLVRDIVKNDPEMLKNVLGQRPTKELIKPSNITKEYLDLHPEAKSWIEAHKQSLEAVEKAAENRKVAARQLNDAKLREKETKEISSLEKKKALDAAKAYDAKIREREGVKSNLQGEMTKHFDEAKKLEDKIPRLESHRDNLLNLEKEEKAKHEEFKIKDKQLKNAAKQRDLTLDQKVKAERQIKSIEQKIKTIQTRIATIQREIKYANTEIKNTHYGVRLAFRMGWNLLKKAKNLFT